MASPFTSQDVRGSIADLDKAQEAYLEAYGCLLRMGLSACSGCTMQKGSAGFRHLEQDLPGWEELVRNRGAMLQGGAELLALALDLQDAEAQEVKE